MTLLPPSPFMQVERPQHDAHVKAAMRSSEYWRRVALLDLDQAKAAAARKRPRAKVRKPH